MYMALVPYKPFNDSGQFCIKQVILFMYGHIANYKILIALRQLWYRKKGIVVHTKHADKLRCISLSKYSKLLQSLMA